MNPTGLHAPYTGRRFIAWLAYAAAMAAWAG